MRGFFTAILVLMAIGGTMFGLMAVMNAESAVHEIEALISFLTVGVCAGAGYVGAAVDEAAKRIAPPPPPSNEAKKPQA